MKIDLPIERIQLIEDFGNAYASFGQPRIRGRIIGLLLSSVDPLSLDDIVELLKTNKGSLSVETRQLEEFGFIRSVRKPSDRKVYFEITDHPFSISSRRNLWLIRRNQQIASSYLEGKTALPKVVQTRFERMERFHSELHDIFADFIKRWQ